MKRICLTLFAATMFMGTALAGRIHNRQEAQQDRIAHGVARGSLTPRETIRLERQAEAVNREIRRDRIDGGGLSLRERRKIERHQDQLSRHIAKQKHDRQRR